LISPYFGSTPAQRLVETNHRREITHRQRDETDSRLEDEARALHQDGSFMKLRIQQSRMDFHRSGELAIAILVGANIGSRLSAQRIGGRFSGHHQPSSAVGP